MNSESSHVSSVCATRPQVWSNSTNRARRRDAAGSGDRHSDLDWSFDYGYVVTAHEPDRLVEVEKPFPMTARYELADAPEGTNVAIRATESPTGLFAIAEPLLRWQVRRNIAADLQRLEENVER